jgi:hypothetical protein
MGKDYLGMPEDDSSRRQGSAVKRIKREHHLEIPGMPEEEAAKAVNRGEQRPWCNTITHV